MKKPFTKKISLLVATLALSFTGLNAATTDPVGYVTLEVAAGTGSVKTTNVLSIPLLPSAESITGQSVGVISGVTSNSIQASLAGWSAGQLSNASSPYLLKITSGTAEGLTLPISTTSANTSTEAFVVNTFSGESLDLTAVGISTGVDTYKIIPADTLSSLFGTPGTTNVHGGTSATTADTLLLFDNGWNVYYYSTDTTEWVKSVPGLPNADNVVLHPDYAVLYERLVDTPLSLTVAGEVSTSSRNIIIKDAGVTFMANGWPVDTTLADTGLENTTGWVTGASATASDQVIIRGSSGWDVYFHNGTNWVKSVPGFPVADTESLPAGEGLIINRIGTGGGLQQLGQLEPYTF